MTLKQRIFCLEYTKDFNESRAMKAAGYSENSQSPFLSEEITAECQRLINERAKRLMIDGDWVVLQLAENAEIARRANDFNASNVALRTLAEMFGQLGRLHKGAETKMPALNVGVQVVNQPQQALAPPQPSPYATVGVFAGGSRIPVGGDAGGPAPALAGHTDMLTTAEGLPGCDHVPGAICEPLPGAPPA